MAKKQQKDNKSNLNRNNRALKLALGSLAKRGVVIEDFADNFSLVITLSCMTGTYYKYLSKEITQEECITKIEEHWEKTNGNNQDESF